MKFTMDCQLIFIICFAYNTLESAMSLGYERYINKVIIIFIIMLLLKILFVIGSQMPSSAMRQIRDSSF